MDQPNERPPREGVLSGPYLQNNTLQVWDRGVFALAAGTPRLLRSASPARMLIAVYPVTAMSPPRLYPFEPPALFSGVVPTTFPEPVVWHVAAMPGIALGDVWCYIDSGGSVRVIEVLTKTVR